MGEGGRKGRFGVQVLEAAQVHFICAFKFSLTSLIHTSELNFSWKCVLGPVFMHVFVAALQKSTQDVKALPRCVDIGMT